MKTLLTMILASASLAAWSQSSSKVYFIRAEELRTGIKSFVNVGNTYLYIDKSKKCGLTRNHEYAVLDVSVGEHAFTTIWGKNGSPEGSIKINIEPEKKYYVTYVFGEPLREVTEGTGERLISTLMPSDCDEIEK